MRVGLEPRRELDQQTRRPPPPEARSSGSVVGEEVFVAGLRFKLLGSAPRFGDQKMVGVSHALYPGASGHSSRPLTRSG